MTNVSNLARHFGSKQRIRILDLIKRFDSCSVRELAAELELSYMGAKQHCQALQKEGYLVTWRRPREGVVGRPEVAYRLTSKSEAFYPSAANSLTTSLLSAAAELYGPLAPEKLLLRYYEQLKADYSSRIQTRELTERISVLAKLRDADGYMARVDSDNPYIVVEKHTPVADVLTEYPCLARFEQELYSDLTGVECRRIHEDTKTGYHCEFHCSTSKD